MVRRPAGRCSAVGYSPLQGPVRGIDQREDGSSGAARHAFGLIHGKAGVIRRADGSATAFLGSVNESSSAWKLNYELLWEDDSLNQSHGCRRSSTHSGMITEQ